jgi:hypothetical protein
MLDEPNDEKGEPTRIALLDQMQIDAASSNVFWRPGSFKLTDVDLKIESDTPSRTKPSLCALPDTYIQRFSPSLSTGWVQVLR